LELEGTTFSGHSTKTTLGNTLRTLCYLWYYIKLAGLSSTPWECALALAIAAGDDGVVFVHPKWTKKLRETIRANTTLTADRYNEDGSRNALCLGQRVKVVHSGRFWEIEFLSKWSFSDGTLEGWMMCRDLKKIMSKKQFFTGHNKQMLHHPWLHRTAILEGLESE